MLLTTMITLPFHPLMCPWMELYHMAAWMSAREICWKDTLCSEPWAFSVASFGYKVMLYVAVNLPNHDLAVLNHKTIGDSEPARGVNSCH